MNEIKLLLGIVNDMRSLADSLQSIAESIQVDERTEGSEPIPALPSVSKPVPAAQAITVDEVRSLLAQKSSEGKAQAIKALLSKYHAEKLSGVKPEDYAPLLEEAKDL